MSRTRVIRGIECECTTAGCGLDCACLSMRDVGRDCGCASSMLLVMMLMLMTGRKA